MTWNKLGNEKLRTIIEKFLMDNRLIYVYHRGKWKKWSNRDLNLTNIKLHNNHGNSIKFQQNINLEKDCSIWTIKIQSEDFQHDISVIHTIKFEEFILNTFFWLDYLIVSYL